MKNIYIKGWKNLISDHDDKESEFVREEKVREGGIINVNISLIECSCSIAFFDSAYLKNETEIAFGKASSAVDRAFELALSTMKENESARVDITMKGEYVHEKCRESVVKLNCQLSYSIVTNGKEAHEYSAEEKLSFGRRYKEVALQKLSESNVNSHVYKYPIQLSVFLLIARAIKWLALISADDLEEEDRDSLNLLKIQCYSNLSQFHLTFGNYERAVSTASVALERSPDNVKALFRRAMGNSNLQNYELAEADFHLVLSKDPLNKAAKKQLEIVMEKKKKLDDKYAQAMKKFLCLT